MLISPVAAIVYFARIRPGLAPHGDVAGLDYETRVRIVRGPDEGRVGQASPGKGVHGVVFALVGYTWFTFADTGERVAVSKELLEPVDNS